MLLGRLNLTFELVELFKTEQASTEVSLAQLAAGGVVRNTRKKYSTKQKRLAKIGEKFESGHYTLEEYIDGISKWMGFSMYCVFCHHSFFLF